jgi:hypothetical protein
LAAAIVLIARGGSSKWAKSWDPRVTDMVTFVENDRELTFKHPIKVLFLTDAEFDAFLKRGSGITGGGGDKNAYIVQQALGMVASDYDPAKGRAGEDASTVGLYTPDDKTIRVRGSELTPEVRITLVHELVHALQDQSFNLGKVDSQAKTEEEGRGLVAIIEGDAVLVEQNYYASLNDADQEAIANAEGGGSLPDLPPAIIATFGLPYLVGDEFVYLAAADGPAARDALFTDPPRSSLALLDPLSYKTAGETIDVKRPDLAEAVTNVPEELGAAQWFYAFSTALSPLDTRAAIRAFGRDRASFTRASGSLCVTDHVAPRTASQRDKLRQTFDTWAKADSTNRTITDDGATITVKSCATTSPKGDAKIRPSLNELEARNNLMGALRHGEAVDDNKAAMCVADDAIDNLGADRAQQAVANDDLTTLVDDATACKL